MDTTERKGVGIVETISPASIGLFVDTSTEYLLFMGKFFHEAIEDPIQGAQSPSLSFAQLCTRTMFTEDDLISHPRRSLIFIQPPHGTLEPTHAQGSRPKNERVCKRNSRSKAGGSVRASASPAYPTRCTFSKTRTGTNPRRSSRTCGKETTANPSSRTRSNESTFSRYLTSRTSL